MLKKLLRKEKSQPLSHKEESQPSPESVQIPGQDDSYHVTYCDETNNTTVEVLREMGSKGINYTRVAITNVNETRGNIAFVRLDDSAKRTTDLMMCGRGLNIRTISSDDQAYSSAHHFFRSNGVKDPTLLNMLDNPSKIEQTLSEAGYKITKL